MQIKSYKDLRVWQNGIRLVKEIYLLTETLPPIEKYGICSQLQRAAVSIPANIAEGYGRQHKKEYIRHLTIANGSLKEVETLVEISYQLGYLAADHHEALLRITEDEGRMLNGLMQSLRKSPVDPKATTPSV
jgi:four helix bundle protein